MQLHNSGDPTRSQTLRYEYASHLRGGFAKVSAMVRRGVRDRDIFELRQNAPEFPVFRFETDEDKHDEFMQWLMRAEEDEILTRITRDHNPYVRSGYDKGVRWAEARMREENIPVDDVDEIFHAPRHQRAVEELYTRNFEQLERITSTMNTQISEELSEGFVQGLHPTEISRNLTNRIDAVGKHRATLLARTEIINAHTEATLNRYEDMGIEEVGYQAEHLTAGDNRVCAICASLEGETYTIQEVREGTFQVDEESFPGLTPGQLGTYARKPPIHPQCRCTLAPKRTD